jgi:hypothetical protein
MESFAPHGTIGRWFSGLRPKSLDTQQKLVSFCATPPDLWKSVDQSEEA